MKKPLSMTTLISLLKLQMMKNLITLMITKKVKTGMKKMFLRTTLRKTVCQEKMTTMNIVMK